ncbi:hypothetical protein ACIQMJ_01695 [Actinosynnema sp. NPDC091369]
MIDLGDGLPIGEAARAWTAEAAWDVASSLVAGTPLELDWDGDAGEDWISLHAGTPRVGMVSAVLPLAVIADGHCPSADQLVPAAVKVVRVPSFNDPVLFCDPDVLAEAFGATTSAILGDAPFSANDLWFASI